MKRITPSKTPEDHVLDDVVLPDPPVAKPARKVSGRPRVLKRGRAPSSVQNVEDTSSSSSESSPVVPNEHDDHTYGADVVKKGEDGLYHFSEEEVRRIARAAVAAQTPMSISGAVPSQVEEPSHRSQQSAPTEPTATAKYLYNLLRETGNGKQPLG